MCFYCFYLSAFLRNKLIYIYAIHVWQWKKFFSSSCLLHYAILVLHIAYLKNPGPNSFSRTLLFLENQGKKIPGPLGGMGTLLIFFCPGIYRPVCCNVVGVDSDPTLGQQHCLTFTDELTKGPPSQYMAVIHRNYLL